MVVGSERVDKTLQFARFGIWTPDPLWVKGTQRETHHFGGSLKRTSPHATSPKLLGNQKEILQKRWVVSLRSAQALRQMANTTWLSQSFTLYLRSVLCNSSAGDLGIPTSFPNPGNALGIPANVSFTPTKPISPLRFALLCPFSRSWWTTVPLLFDRQSFVVPGNAIIFLIHCDFKKPKLVSLPNSRL